MAIQAPIRKEINEYQSKLFFGLSGRQLIFSISGVAVGAASYYLLSKVIGTELAGYAVIALVSPLFAFGFVKIDGEAFEKYLLKLYHYALYPKARVYSTYISHYSPEQKHTASNRERRDAKKANHTSSTRETLIEEYDVASRQRENAAAYKRTK